MRRRALLASATSLAALARAAYAQPYSGCLGPNAGPASPGNPSSCLGPRPTAGPSLELNFINGSAMDSRITYTGANGTYFNNAGQLTAALVNAARFDFDPVTFAARGLLVEENRTNLVLNNAVTTTQSVAVTAQPYVLSFYGTGTVTLSGAFAGTLNGAGAFPARATLAFTPAAGTLTATVAGTVQYGQIEAGPFATSPIITAGAAITRTADMATLPIGSWYTPGAWTMAADVTIESAASPGVYGAAEFNDATTANRIFLGLSVGTLTGRTNNIIAGVGQGVALTVNSATATVPAKIALAQTPTAGTLVLNGGAAATIAWASGLPPGLSRLQVGSLSTANSLNGWLRRIRYWPRALSSAELQSVTT